MLTPTVDYKYPNINPPTYSLVAVLTRFGLFAFRPDQARFAAKAVDILSSGFARSLIAGKII